MSFLRLTRAATVGLKVCIPISNCRLPAGNFLIISLRSSGRRSGTISKCKKSPRSILSKKKFKIAGDFSEIKVKFKYHVIDSWGVNDYGFAGFAVQESGSTFRVGWLESMPTLESANNRFSTNAFESATQFAGFNTVTDLSRDVEMTARRSNIAPTDEFWVFIGSATNGIYGVGPVEIWVR